jgi:hypothetical protein
MKRKLQRIVSMLTRMAMKFDGVAGAEAGYRADSDYEHEHEHEAPRARTNGWTSAADRVQRDGRMIGRRPVIRSVRRLTDTHACSATTSTLRHA